MQRKQFSERMLEGPRIRSYYISRYILTLKP